MNNIVKLDNLADIRSIITMPFRIDSGEDDSVLETLESWIQDKKIRDSFRLSSDRFFVVSPDLDEIRIYIMDKYIIISCYCGIMHEEGEIEPAGEGKFFIGKDGILKQFSFREY